MISLKSLFRTSKKSRNRHTFTDDDRERASQVREWNQKEKELDFEVKRIMKQMEIEEKKEELEMLREERQLRLMQKRSELYGDGEDEDSSGDFENQMMMMLLAPMLQKMQPQQNNDFVQPANGIPKAAVEKISYSDDELRELIGQFPKKQLKLAKKLPDDTLKKSIHAYMPGLEPQVADRAVELLKNEF